MTCCESVPEIDIISIDTSQKSSIRFKRSNIRSAVNKGINFEFNYSPAIHSSCYRQNLISQLSMLLCIEPRIKNVMLNSGAQKCLDMRGPYDVANLGILFGFKENNCSALCGSVCENTIRHAEHRKFNKYGVKIYDQPVIIKGEVPDNINQHEKTFQNDVKEFNENLILKELIMEENHLEQNCSLYILNSNTDSVPDVTPSHNN
ncbi:unnamed protein product [Gordionus sp. m RMFG-2023]